ncbi:MAG: hypothetical protein VX549_12625 [Pseudomonadota bacterium]|nr:hypothetical protein [Pseudomonadota bacterium]
MHPVHLYASPSGRVLAVDDCDAARRRLPPLALPPAMFFGRGVPPPVAEQCLRECGGLWLRAEGLQRFPPPPADDGPADQAASVSTKNAV